MRIFRKTQSYMKDRAWIEIDKVALEKNVRFLQSRLPAACALMPAVKADAYGHGAVLIARELNRLGIRSFCVACMEEALTLRKSYIKGEILILGYTHPRQFHFLRRYRLTQTVVDCVYAEKLEQYGKELKVHLGIDTGMHRLGERVENMDGICRILEMKNLKVEGIFTHFSMADSLTSESLAYTKMQADAFRNFLRELEKKGWEMPKIHMISSYGALNYPNLGGDYARVGIALYGVLSNGEDGKIWRSHLAPALSLKTRIASVRTLHAGEWAGYGMVFKAQEEMKIAALAIGYADGLPRNLSKRDGFVLINGKKAPVVGRICMDQMLVDVSHIENVRAGGIAVVIGASGEEEIRVEEIADVCDTISNEILSRLGSRLKRLLV